MNNVRLFIHAHNVAYCSPSLHKRTASPCLRSTGTTCATRSPSAPPARWPARRASLGVNHTTVLRRLDALEAHLGSRLFDRQRSGYQPTEAGLALLEQARHMAARADEIERQVLGRDRELTGALRVTTAFVVMDHLLPQPLADFARAYPGHRGRGGRKRLPRRSGEPARRHRPGLDAPRGRRGAAPVGPGGRAPGRPPARHDAVPRLRAARRAGPAAEP